MEIIFAHPRYEYSSYIDYQKLVDLAEFKTCFVDEIDFTQKDTTYIVSPLNGEYRPHRDNWRDKPHNARVISWCLERPGGAGGLRDFVNGTRKLLDDWYFDEVWLSDRWLAGQVHDSRVTFVALGSHEGLAKEQRRRADNKFEYQIVHLSYKTYRRMCILDAVRDRGHSMAPDSSWPPERDGILAGSAFMLNIHQDDWPIIEPLRFALAAAYSIPMITEYIEDAYPYTRQGEEHYVKQMRYENLVDEVSRTVKLPYEKFRAMGRRAHDLMTTEYEFGRQVRLAVGKREALIDPVVIK